MTRASIRPRRRDGRFVGRSYGEQPIFFDGNLPLGHLLMGWLAGHYGAPIALLIGLLLSLLTVGAGWIWRHPAKMSLATSERW